jgi:hypothetical protein
MFYFIVKSVSILVIDWFASMGIYKAVGEDPETFYPLFIILNAFLSYFWAKSIADM